ncbi:MAG TPA: amidase [Burkholderiales bacterium]|nr:amidase [Burkholderiales bacterium]
MSAPVTLAQLGADLTAGRITSRALTDACLGRIDDAAGEGARAFIRVHRDVALASADAYDRLRAAGAALPPLAGIPISIKDLFDVAGEVTRAGSVVLADAPPTPRDAPIVARLRQAGAVIVGRTNMTEFAFSGIGINPHYDTPRNPYDRATGRIPGGSSSGAAVSVTDAMAAAAIGTDTGGSVRIPAALCGITGFKPTARRVPLGGCFPLSRSLDSIGPLAASVSCCALLDAILAGEEYAPPAPLPIAGLRLGVPKDLVLDDLDGEVAHAFARALTRLSAAGARVEEFACPALLDIADINKQGGFAVLEAYALHRRLLAERGDRYDPRVASRILRGREASAADYIDLIDRRAAFIAAAGAQIARFDALAFPTAQLIAPPLADLVADDKTFFNANARALRNTSTINLLDGCALSVPCHEPGAAPVGLMLAAAAGADRRVLAAGLAVEATLARR